MLDENKLKYRNEIEYDWDKISFYALYPNWDSKKVEPFDIFHSGKFQSYCTTLFGKNILNNFEAFKAEIKTSLSAAYQGKREYEMSIGDLYWNGKDVPEDHFEKINVYQMVLPNLDIIARLLFENARYSSNK